ncbi:MAG: hypothetical protein R6T98_15775 [Desulfatiglandales bacterium]
MKNPAIFTIPKKTMDFFEVTGGFRLGEPPARRGQNSPMDTLLKRPTREPWPPARLRPGGDSAPEGRAYAPERTEKKPIVFRSIGAMQSLSK